VAISRYLESRKNIAGSACGLVGLVLTFAGVAGPYWPVVVAGLYGAGALIAPPERPAPPDLPDPSAHLDEVRGDFEKVRAYLTDIDLSVTAAARLRELTELLTALLDEGWSKELLAHDPEGVHSLSRIVRRDLPEAVDSFVRTRWWTRMTPGTESPELHLEQQLGLMKQEAQQLAAALRDTEARRQETHTRYLEGRGGHNGISA
jgi:DNA-binding PucR family transcriptional regulator